MSTFVVIGVFALAGYAVRSALVLALHRAVAWEDARLSELRDRQWVAAAAEWTVEPRPD